MTLAEQEQRYIEAHFDRETQTWDNTAPKEEHQRHIRELRAQMRAEKQKAQVQTGNDPEGKLAPLVSRARDMETSKLAEQIVEHRVEADGTQFLLDPGYTLHKHSRGNWGCTGCMLSGGGDKREVEWCPRFKPEWRTLPVDLYFLKAKMGGNGDATCYGGLVHTEISRVEETDPGTGETRDVITRTSRCDTCGWGRATSDLIAPTLPEQKVGDGLVLMTAPPTWRGDPAGDDDAGSRALEPG